MPAPLRAALLLALALAPAAARAEAPLLCPDGVPEDLGGGIVGLHRSVSLGEDGGPPYADDALVTHCASGRSLTVALDWGDAATQFRAVRLVVRGAIDSPEQVTLEALRDRLESAVNATAWADDLSPLQETCGCHALHPELRGAKTPWPD